MYLSKSRVSNYGCDDFVNNVIAIKDINRNIHKAVNTVRSKVKKDLQEPDYTAALAIEFPKLMNASGKYPTIKFGGCFIHQSPRVKFMGRQKQESCELGDLLVLVRKQTMDGERYNAALLQFKMSDKSPEELKKDGDFKQLFLYENWPEFEIGKLKSKYDIRPKVVNQGALYCMIQETIPQFYMAEPMKTMSYCHNNTFGRFLVNMINRQAGRAISEEPARKDDEWSKLIWDLIENSLNTKFNRENVDYKNVTRLSDGFLMLINKLPDIDSIINGNDYNGVNDDDSSGISILFIDIDDREK
ncbi:MAG: hypothetical protein IK004_09515 [Bacteroidales bacterium]|nr:hypothetical protein [Bacteroidales bacterium]